MIYNDIFKEIILECKKDVEKFHSGDKKDYLYKKVRDKEYGDTDGNYTNRTRICFGLLYNSFEYDTENIIRELFETEVVSRENESFQGIGVNLEILTFLLKKYNNPDDLKLFERAKNANFDCCCGYEVDFCNYSTPADELSAQTCIYNASYIDDNERLFKMVDIFKENMQTKDDYSQLDSFSRLTKRMSDRKISSEYFYEYYKNSDEKYEKSSAVGRYLRYLIDDGQAEKAEAIFLENLESFEGFNRHIYEFGSQIILLNPPHKEKIWKTINPAIIKDFKNIAPMDCRTIAECAEIMGENKLAKQIMKMHDKKMKGIEKLSD